MKRLENIRDFIINEMDNGNIPKGTNYNENLDIIIARGNFYLNITIYNWNIFNDEVMEIFKEIDTSVIYDNFNKSINLSMKYDDIDFKLLNRKRKLWMLKD